MNAQIDATHAELLPAVHAAMGVDGATAVDPGDLVDARITGASVVVT
ncbi:MAG: Phospho-2-dehydro-3-deoxyheptonate aldolase, partial [Klenkia sp.]|nr:Phospho-2-dehydro-3-deoxyheptonate aldolase [Klenkia sp.]